MIVAFSFKLKRACVCMCDMRYYTTSFLLSASIVGCVKLDAGTSFLNLPQSRITSYRSSFLTAMITPIAFLSELTNTDCPSTKGDLIASSSAIASIASVLCAPGSSTKNSPPEGESQDKHANDTTLCMECTEFALS